MDKKLVYCIILLIILVTAGAARAQDFGRSDAVERMTAGTINWTTGEVYARGIGSPPARAMNAAQARAMAARAAQAVAYRNLLQTVKGVRIDSVSVVENVMVKSDVIRTRIEGIVKGARTLKSRYRSDGSVEVLVVMPMKGAFISAVIPDDFGTPAVTPLPVKPAPVLPKIPDTKPTPSVPEPTRPVPRTEPEPPSPPPAPAPLPLPEPSGPATDQRGTATGLVIDGRGLGETPRRKRRARPGLPFREVLGLG